MAVTPDGTRALTTDNVISGTVSVIEHGDAERGRHHPRRQRSDRGGDNPDGARALATNAGSGTVSVIDLATQRVITAIPVGLGPVGVAVTPDGGHALATSRDAGARCR